MGKFLGNVIIIASWLGGLYVGVWVMFIQPIISACQAFDAGTLTGSIVGITVLKCIFASCVGVLIGYAGTILGYFIKSVAARYRIRKLAHKKNKI